MPAVINVIGFIRKDQAMHSHAISRKKTSPLERIMMDIKDTSSDIRNTAYWLKDPDPEWCSTESTIRYLKLNADRLDNVYNQLRDLTGAHPCK